MATIRILLGIICLAFSGGYFEPSGDLLGGDVDGMGRSINRLYLKTAHDAKDNYRVKSLLKDEAHARILKIARSQIGIREATGRNDGTAVEAYLHYTGNKKGQPWCASFVSWVFGQAGFSEPKTAASPSLFPDKRLTSEPLPAAVFGIYFPNLKRIGHCGLVRQQQGNWIHTIEGNTNLQGSREGDGVYCKIRHVKTIKLFADWIGKAKRGGLP